MQESGTKKQKKTAIVAVVIIAIIFIVAVITGIVFLARSTVETTGRIRDIFIIVLALESLLIGTALIILVIQLAVLTNLVKNEVRPILASTKEAVGTLRGTSKFISKRAVAPIISVSSTLAGFGKMLEIIGFIRKK